VGDCPGAGEEVGERAGDVGDALTIVGVAVTLAGLPFAPLQAVKSALKLVNPANPTSKERRESREATICSGVFFVIISFRPSYSL